jgi:2-alkyl-3-oxoalkanoate reductase
MKVFVAGATGAMGRTLIPRLVQQGHEVVGMTRSAARQDAVRRLGARPAVADALDPDAVAQAVAAAEPEVVVHQLTALAEARPSRRVERTFAATNRLRTEGTDHLLAAAQAVGARRVVAQSFGAFRFSRTGGPALPESLPLDPDAPPPSLRGVQAAYSYLERAVTGIEWGEGIALRYGGFYGPGTGVSRAPDAELGQLVRARRLPVVGDGGGITSHVHIDDAAAATLRAIEGGAPGVYNVVDDDPAPMRDWVPALADALGAKPPRHAPRWVVGALAGGAVAAMLTETHGADNAKAKRELGWTPRYASWREGFVDGLDAR